MEVVGRQAESFSVEGGMRNLHRLAAANHAGHRTQSRRGAGCPLVLVGLTPDLGGSCLIQSQLPASSVPDADSSSPGVAKPTCEVPRIPTMWLFLFLSNAWLA